MPETWYVNVYELDRHYGGPEEGGWWFTSGTPVHSVITHNREAAEERRVELREGEFKKEKGVDLYSMAYRGGAFEIYVEDHPAEAWPAERPHYE